MLSLLAVSIYYASREHASEGVLLDLWAKALKKLKIFDCCEYFW